MLLFFAIAHSALAVVLRNPLGSGRTDPRIIIGDVIQAVLGIVGSVTLAMFIYGGFMWMLSGGNPERVKKGRDTIVWSSLGLAVIFFGYAIISFILRVLVG